ncbi:sensor histidine kinase [Gracilimonas mengyeensis]|uniref:histidine kinase n=1 Tax=Gracilimonas mengyeensis TaxID=1302730 RepID=A0A521CQH3_9BACT|nr:ATP-binding protein [Gracilimonas mengyeensis]SMO61658.1 two-component system, OmpR family, phosphate regulon sensor histidine kinase PhoR [Gracilimonas mengyeensis]
MSQSKRDKQKLLFRFGFRIAFRVAAASAVFLYLLFWLYLQLVPKEAASLALITGLFILLLTYGISYFYAKQRFKIVERLFKNIARKRFMEYAEVSSSQRDELDYLTKQGIKSSRTIEREIQRLNRIENYRKEFIGDISHELKTPIFAIQGFIETLLNGALEDEEVNREFLRKAMRNVNRLIYLTKDLMEISKLETGELKSEIEEIYLYEVIHDIIESLNYKAEKENIKLTIHDFDKNLKVKVDKNQVKQVFINLIENAIKYNVPNGEVEVYVYVKPKQPERVFVSVKDTGIGIDEKDIPRVTERFFRVDKSRSRERGGTGLGLAIVKHIMEAHGEKFHIESEPNKGSTFTISLHRADMVRV